MSILDKLVKSQLINQQAPLPDPSRIYEENAAWIKDTIKDNPGSKLVIIEDGAFIKEYRDAEHMAEVREFIEPNVAMRIHGEGVFDYFELIPYADGVIGADGQPDLNEEEECKLLRAAEKLSDFTDRIICSVMDKTGREVVNLVGGTDGGQIYAIVK